jgi:hypothetical protein
MGRPNKYVNIVKAGQRYGEWTVTGAVRKDAHGHALVSCICTCGTVRDQLCKRLVNAETTQCQTCATKPEARSGNNNSRWTSGNIVVPASLTNRYVSNSLHQSASYTLSEADIQRIYCEQNGQCAVTGQPISLNYVGPGEPFSIQTIDASRGYVPDNIKLTVKTKTIFQHLGFRR